MSQAPVVIRGLDLISPPTMVAPGSLRECLNHERGLLAGMSRIDGFRRVDGDNIDGIYRVFAIMGNIFADYPAGTEVGFVIVDGGFVHLGGGYLLNAADSQGGTDPVDTLYVAFPGTEVFDRPTSDFFALNFRAADYPVTPDVTIMSPPWNISIEQIAAEYGADSINGALFNIMEATTATVEDVPGNPGSDIIGLFGLKNRLYAIRDLMRSYFTDGMYTDANEGEYLTLGGSEYQVLAVTQTDGDNGFLTLDPVAGSGDNVAPIGTPTSFTLSGTFDDDDASSTYSDGPLTVAGGTVETWSVLDDVLTGSSLIDADNPSLVGQQTNAALWKSDADDGWSRVELGREMLFSDGTVNLVNFIRDAVLDGAEIEETGDVFPTSSTLNGSATTGVNLNDGTTTALSGASGDIIVAKGFDFTDIPSSAIIRGLTVTIERQSDTANQAKDNTVTLVGVTGGAENKARGDAWPNSIATATYGGTSDLWGNQSITVADLQSADFGVMLIADRFASGTAAVGGVDYISVDVAYVERDTPAFVWDGTTDQEITVRHIQVLGGDTEEDSAYGYLTLTAPKNADKTRLINVGDEIRNAASGGGDFLAIVAARDVPIFFPGQTDIDNNASQYKVQVENFYASDQLDAAYIVCGVGPCTAFDGARTIRIRTQVPAQDDNPRHVSKHGQRLSLGYYGGLLYQSVAGDPFEMRGERGALPIPFGDRVMGLRKAEGDRLLVPCENSIQQLTGYTSATHLRDTITEKRGMLEYSDLDMGVVLGCDGQGVFDVSAPIAFGPSERNYLSHKVAPWLRPRLQSTDNAGQPAIRLTTAVSVRAKNQGRWYFMDGWILTMTAEDPIEFTTQRYVDRSQNDAPLTVRAVCTWVDASGRERLFASFRSAKEGYVFELDSGRSFDGDAIPAYLVLNPIAPSGIPSQLAHFDNWWVYGSGYGVANLTCSRAVNYGTPDYNITIPLEMGSASAEATNTSQPFRGFVDFPIEGNDITLRFDSDTADEGPYTLQFTTITVDSRGWSRGYKGD